MLDQLGDRAIDETPFDPRSSCFEMVHATTWDELETNGWIERLDEVGMYRLTGCGWLGALQLTCQLVTSDFEARIRRTLAALKAHVKGRTKPALVPLKQIAEEAGLPEGFVYNVVESRLVEEHHGRIGARWQDKGRVVFVPRHFDIQTIDLNALISEEAQRRMEELEAQLQRVVDELGRYQCPHCKAPLSATGAVEVGEHHTGCFEEFECGYTAMDGCQERPCPKDPKFPKLEEFDLRTEKQGDEWVCFTVGKSRYARQLGTMQAVGRTEEQARHRVITEYNYKAGLISNRQYMAGMLG